MTEIKKHQLDELSATDILSYLTTRVSNMEEYIRRANMGFTLPKDILGLWEQTVCEIRGEIESSAYAKELCDKLENSMCALAGGPYNLRYSIGD